MIRCLICNPSYSRRDALQRHERNVHGSGKYTDQSQPLKEITFRHPFSMMVTGPSGSGKTEWTRKTVTFLVSTTATGTNLMVFCTMAAPVRRPSEENSVYRIYMGYPRLSR